MTNGGGSKTHETKEPEKGKPAESEAKTQAKKEEKK
jgi:hypothetical protein